MTKLNLLLLAALLASCLLLVKTAYEARRVFAALDKARGEQRQLDVEYKRLDSERQAQATNSRVDRVARDKLGMRTATPGVTQYVFDGAGSQGNARLPEVSLPPTGDGPGAARTSGSSGVLR